MERRLTTIMVADVVGFSRMMEHAEEATAEQIALCHSLISKAVDAGGGRVFSRAELLDRVWGYGHVGYEHTVNSHINRLRAKIESDPTQPKFIVTVWGVGYKMNGSLDRELCA